MKTYFGKIHCQSCHTEYDVTESECPHCHQGNPTERVSDLFGHQVHVKWGKQLALFLTGMIGLYLIVFVVTLCFEIPYLYSHTNPTAAEVTAYMGSPDIQMGVTGTTYLVLLLTLSLILLSDNKKLFTSFKNWKAVLWGFIGIAALYLFSFAYSLFMSSIYKLAGRVLPDANANESGIRTLTTAYPVLAMIVFGFVGPICEEITYRIGLFGLSSRFGRVVAYVVTALVFAGMHFSWSSITNPTYAGQIIDELALIPPYVFAGLAFGFLYDRYGFAASLTAHVGNNVISLLITMFSRS